MIPERIFNAKQSKFISKLLESQHWVAQFEKANNTTHRYKQGLPTRMASIIKTFEEMELMVQLLNPTPREPLTPIYLPEDNDKRIVLDIAGKDYLPAGQDWGLYRKICMEEVDDLFEKAEMTKDNYEYSHGFYMGHTFGSTSFSERQATLLHGKGLEIKARNTTNRKLAYYLFEIALQYSIKVHLFAYDNFILVKGNGRGDNPSIDFDKTGSGAESFVDIYRKTLPPFLRR